MTVEAACGIGTPTSLVLLFTRLLSMAQAIWAFRSGGQFWVVKIIRVPSGEVDNGQA